MQESIYFVKEALKEPKNVVVLGVALVVISGLTIELKYIPSYFKDLIILFLLIGLLSMWLVNAYYEKKIKVLDDWQRRQVDIMTRMLRETGVSSVFYEAFRKETKNDEQYE